MYVYMHVCEHAVVCSALCVYTCIRGVFGGRREMFHVHLYKVCMRAHFCYGGSVVLNVHMHCMRCVYFTCIRFVRKGWVLCFQRVKQVGLANVYVRASSSG